MPRMARSVVAGIPHHVTQRGNRREDVFFTDDDRRRYLELLQEYSDQHGLEIQAYCLMSNHLHLIVVPRSEEALSAVLKPVHARYAQHVNWTHHVEGRLWQGRYFSCPLDEPHWLTAIRYVERNPVRAKLTRRAETYAWSSAAGHAGLRFDPLLSGSLPEQTGIEDWAAWLHEKEDTAAIERLRQHTRTGRPLGDETFIRRLERICGRVLRPKKAGRPREIRRTRQRT